MQCCYGLAAFIDNSIFFDGNAGHIKPLPIHRMIACRDENTGWLSVTVWPTSSVPGKHNG